MFDLLFMLGIWWRYGWWISSQQKQTLMKELLSHFGCFILGALTMLLAMALSGANGKDEPQSDN